jgi:hypothetical protein
LALEQCSCIIGALEAGKIPHGQRTVSILWVSEEQSCDPCFGSQPDSAVCEVFFWRDAISLFTVTYDSFEKGE